MVVPLQTLNVHIPGELNNPQCLSLEDGIGNAGNRTAGPCYSRSTLLAGEQLRQNDAAELPAFVLRLDFG